MSWIPEWGPNEVSIKHPQLHNFSLWRSLDYYVDVGSEEKIELGTKKYPYK